MSNANNFVIYGHIIKVSGIFYWLSELVISVKESNFQIETVSAMYLKKKSTDTKVCQKTMCNFSHH